MVITKKSPLSLIHLPYLPYIYIYLCIYMMILKDVDE